MSKSKCTKHLRVGPFLEVEMLKKCTPLWREAHFESKALKTAGPGPRFEVGMWFCVAGARASAPGQKWVKREGFVAVPKTMAGMTFEEDLQRCILLGRRSTRDMFVRDVRRPGRWFPERGSILEHHIFRFAKTILRDRCSTSYDLASLFCGRRSTSDRWSRKNTKRIGTRPSALHSTFQFLNEISHNCFVFNVVKFENWGSLTVLFRFWRCQVQKLRKSPRIAAFWCCQVQKLRSSRRVASFSSLQIER